MWYYCFPSELWSQEDERRTDPQDRCQQINNMLLSWLHCPANPICKISFAVALEMLVTQQRHFKGCTWARGKHL
jgi:hypothetical protein